MRSFWLVTLLLFLPSLADGDALEKCVRGLNIGPHDEVVLEKGNGFLSLLDAARVDHGWLSEVLVLNDISAEEVSNPRVGLTVCFKDEWKATLPSMDVRSRSREILRQIIPDVSSGKSEASSDSVAREDATDTEKALISRIEALEREVENLKKAAEFPEIETSTVSSPNAVSSEPSEMDRSLGWIWNNKFRILALGLLLIFVAFLLLLFRSLKIKYQSGRNLFRSLGEMPQRWKTWKGTRKTRKAPLVETEDETLIEIEDKEARP